MKADKEQVMRLLKTARGQLEGILKMIEEDRYCMDIANQILATESILHKASREVLRAHMQGCVRDAVMEGKGDEKILEILTLVDKISK
ncbi:MAG: metal-sensing transcriptional repressor [Anaerovorax sp.]